MELIKLCTSVMPRTSQTVQFDNLSNSLLSLTWIFLHPWCIKICNFPVDSFIMCYSCELVSKLLRNDMQNANRISLSQKKQPILNMSNFHENIGYHRCSLIKSPLHRNVSSLLRTFPHVSFFNPSAFSHVLSFLCPNRLYLTWQVCTFVAPSA